MGKLLWPDRPIVVVACSPYAPALDSVCRSMAVMVPSFMAPSLTVICIWWRELPAVMVSSRV